MPELERPPVGILPKYLHDEKRMTTISIAITGYMGYGMEIPADWIKEYNTLAKAYTQRQKAKQK